ncbi:phosphoenolpyruvate--protein phosphotransferase [Euzebya sp.]|uniref:phosphoenolpyruvate--protein phosphotransferase n=1 Tax=Euzebya sp. TaxID=1971409 RepID=UPI003511B68D
MTTVRERQLTGTGVCAGIGIGPVAQMGTPISELPAARVRNDPAEDRARADRALEEVAVDLERRRDRASGEAVDVLEAQVMMARDPTLASMVADAIDDGKPAAYAVEDAIGHFRSALESAGGYLAERAADLDDLRNRVIARLLHLPMPGVPDRDAPFVLVAEDLAPADTVDLDPAKVVALVTERGGPTSHTAIIAKSLGIPAIVSCRGVVDLDEDTEVIVDGSTGVVTVAPDEAALAAARTRIAEREALLATSTGPGRTADGHAVKLLLNLGDVDDTAAADVDAEGVGLFRTEFLFLDRTEEPTEAEQAAAYRRLFEAFGGRVVVVRTLDVGADKPLPFIDPGPGDNPALGLRGWRLRELEPEVIDRQLRALATAAADAPCDVRVMAPMIATAAEAEGFVEWARSAGLPTVGVMVEVPSLALQAERLVEVVDFVSIGTNDLSQYTFAADRLVGELGELLDPWQPAVLDLVARTAAAGRRADVPVGVCGEAASDPLLALVLTGLGCSSLSMSPAALPEVRASLAGTPLARCEELAELALAAADGRAARLAVADAGS